MRSHGIDVAVLLIFFCRPEQFGQVFDQVRSARPSRLYLYQDGPRQNRPSDLSGIQACREIASTVDWECEVHTFYQEVNQGCDPSEYIAQKWMFETEEMGIVLEDDDVPTQSFFHFCKELLERYKDDERVDRICGMNNIEVAEHIREDYLFAAQGSIWGWASWRRVLDSWDPEYRWLDDASTVRRLRDAFDSSREYQHFLEIARQHRRTGVPHYESVGGFACRSQSRLLIVPRYNLITSVGATEESTHSSSETHLMPRRTRRLFGMRRYELEWPLKHPNIMIRDRAFERAVTGTRLHVLLDRIERGALVVRHRGPRGLLRLLARRLSR